MTEGNIVSIKHFEIHDGAGIRTTVFMKGCPLNCAWCHNPESISANIEIGFLQDKCINCFRCTRVCSNHVVEDKQHVFLRSQCTSKGVCVRECKQEALVLYGRTVSVSDILPELLMDRMFYEDRGGVTISGGEPFFQSKFLIELLCMLKDEGINTALDTSLYCSREVLEKTVSHVDTFLVDIKAYNPITHIKCTGVSNEPILENIKYLDGIGQNVEFRIPVIKGWNDTEMEEIAMFVNSLGHNYPIRLLPYHDFGNSKKISLGELPDQSLKAPSRDELNRIAMYFRRNNSVVEIN